MVLESVFIMKQEEIQKIETVLKENNLSLNEIEWFLQNKRNMVLVDSEILEEIKSALYDEVGSEGWLTKWDVL